jgi:hypothetical protein
MNVSGVRDQRRLGQLVLVQAPYDSRPPLFRGQSTQERGIDNLASSLK